jgi:hypothetical protein
MGSREIYLVPKIFPRFQSITEVQNQSDQKIRAIFRQHERLSRTKSPTSKHCAGRPLPNRALHKGATKMNSESEGIATDDQSSTPHQQYNRMIRNKEDI